MAHARWGTRGRLRRFGGAWRVCLLAGCVAVGAFLLFVLVRRDAAEPRESGAALRAVPSEVLLDATRRVPRSFAEMLVESIHRDGYLTVTVHVALADGASGAAARFTDGSNPKTNLTWGALYGVETHFANTAGWRRAHTDNGDGSEILRRVVFHRTAAPTSAWRALDVNVSFDVYVLANAWPAKRMREAMDRPIRDAMLDEQIVLTVDGRNLRFGSGSVMNGYLGQNAMADEYWDSFAGLPTTHPPRAVGVFYLSSMSAVYLYDTVVRHGLYPVLFTRQPIVPEAYLLDGMLHALLAGELDDGFVHHAAEEYARYQKSVSPPHVRRMLFR